MRMSHLVSLAVFSMLPLFAFAHNDSQCDDGKWANVSGNIITINTSNTRQAGQICVALTSANGNEIFNQCGAILGTILTSNSNTGRSFLRHTALFSKRQAFITKNDVAQITGVQAVDGAGVPCAFSVVENISKIAWSIGILESGIANITAVGTVSTCTNKNLNVFTLSGKACVKEHD